MAGLAGAQMAVTAQPAMRNLHTYAPPMASAHHESALPSGHPGQVSDGHPDHWQGGNLHHHDFPHGAPPPSTSGTHPYLHARENPGKNTNLLPEPPAPVDDPSGADHPYPYALAFHNEASAEEARKRAGLLQTWKDDTPTYVVGCDVGGTFTDLVLIRISDSNIVARHKLRSTPEDPGVAIDKGFTAVCQDAGIGRGQVAALLHGTTLATNTIIERKGARVGLITTEGYRQVLHIDRSEVPEGYDWNRGSTYTTQDRVPAGAAPQRFNTWNQPELLASLDRTIEVRERVDAWGNTLRQVDEQHLRAQVKRLEGRCDAIVVSLVNAYANGGNERVVERIVAEELPGMTISLSHQILPEQCEYERTMTTVVNSYLRPVMDNYLNCLEEPMAHAGWECSIQCVRADGGLAGPDAARELPVNLISSGPAAGIIGAAALCKIAGYRNLITLDIGGTSTDICTVLGGKPSTRKEMRVGDVVVRVPAIDVHNVGCGGGSIVKVPELSRALRVGPESAGAEPGPVCYGIGGVQPTVSDANCVLGNMPGRGLLGGTMKLNHQAAIDAVQHIAEALELSTAAAAEGIIDVTNEAIIGALRVVLVRKGLHPQQFNLCPFGGNGGLHACAIAKVIGAWPIVVPPSPGLLSAMGTLTTAQRSSKSCSVCKPLELSTGAEMRTVLELLAEQARQDLERDGISWEEQIVSYEIDMRFKGESLDMVMTVECNLDQLSSSNQGLEWLREFLETEHLAAYTFTLSEGHEVVALRCTCVGPPQWVQLTQVGVGGVDPIDEALIGTQQHYYNDALYEAVVWERSKLLCGNRLEGPALVLDDDATTLIEVGCVGQIDKFGMIIITLLDTAPRRALDSNTDRITLEVIELGLRTTRQEMDAIVLRTAMSPGIREQHEQYPIITDPLGHMVMGQFGSFVPTFLQTYTQEVCDGDVIVLSDPYTCRGAVQSLNNWLVLTPIYVGDVLVGWASMFGHMTDVGGMYPCSLPSKAQEIFQEGLLVPPTKLYSKGVLNTEVQQLLLHNVRNPEWNRCDLKAIVASCELCKIRVQQICARFGRDTYLQTLALLLRRSWNTMHEIIQTVCVQEDWKYYFEDYVDDDGQGHGPHKLACSMRRVFHSNTNEHHIAFDFSGTDGQLPSALNLYQNVEQFKMLVGTRLAQYFDPQMVPNDGFYPLLDVHIPKGTLLNPTFPAATSCSTPVLGRLFDMLGGLLGQHAPELMCGAGFSDQPKIQYYGQDDGRGNPFMYYGILYGGIPGKPVGDGPDGHSVWPSFSNVQNEFLERELPVRIEARDCVVDSGGAGLHRGGNGVKLVYRLLADGCISIKDDRWWIKPWGVNGGRVAQGSSKYIYRACADDRMTSDVMELVPAKCDQFPVKAGDVLVFITWGGGGWGNPLARDANMVWRDVTYGLVSPQGARHNYGVVIDPNGDGINIEATADLRQKMQKEKLELEGMHRHHDVNYSNAIFDFGWKKGLRATEEELAELRANCKNKTGYDAPQAHVLQGAIQKGEQSHYTDLYWDNMRSAADRLPHGKWTPYDASHKLAQDDMTGEAWAPSHAVRATRHLASGDTEAPPEIKTGTHHNAEGEWCGALWDPIAPPVPPAVQVAVPPPGHPMSPHGHQYPQKTALSPRPPPVPQPPPPPPNHPEFVPGPLMSPPRAPQTDMELYPQDFAPGGSRVFSPPLPRVMQPEPVEALHRIERPQRAHHQQTPEEKRAHAEARALAEVAAQIIPRRFVVEGFASAEQQYQEGALAEQPVPLRQAQPQYAPEPAYVPTENMNDLVSEYQNREQQKLKYGELPPERYGSPDRYQTHALSSLPASGLAGRKSRFA